MKPQTAAALLRNLTAARIPPTDWLSATKLARDAMQRGAVQKLAEFAPFIGLVARQRPRRVLEIGSARGGSLWVWGQVAADDATIVSVDLPQGPFGGGDDEVSVWESYARDGQTLRIIRGDSHAKETRDTVAETLEAVDFLFIDGDHTYEGCLSDYNMYAPFVRTGGMIAFHDVAEHQVEECEVSRVWKEVKKRHSVELVDSGDVRAWGPWGGIGVMWV